MRQRTVVLSALLLLGLATPTWGDTAYVPWAADRSIDGARVETQVKLVNRSEIAVQRARHLLVRSMRDGSGLGAADSRLVAVAPAAGTTLQGVVPKGRSGFLEVTSGPNIEVWSRLIGTAPSGARTVGEFAPAVGADDVFLPGAVTVLEGWRRQPGEVRTDLHLLNLAPHKAVCTVGLARGDGSTVLNGVRLEVPPYSHRPILDALGAAGVDSAGSWSSAITCNRKFYPFLTRQDLVSGAVTTVYPTLAPEAPPAAEGPANPAPPEEPANGGGTAVFERPGTFHVPTQAKEMYTLQMPLPKGTTYSRLVVDMKFTHGGWHRDSDLNHGIFWLNRHPKWGGNVFGYVNAYGPGKSLVKLTSNVGARKRHQMFKSTDGVKLQPGQTYKVHFEYDTRKGKSIAELRTTTGQLVARMELPTRGPIKITDSGGFFIAFGHTRHAVGPEVPTYGWKYSDLKVQFIK